MTSKSRGGRTYLPYAFTEQGVAMLSSVLHSQRAVEVNIAIMRTFVQLRSLMQSNKLLAEKIESLEKKHDQNFQIVFDAIKQLITADSSPTKELGFHTINKQSKFQPLPPWRPWRLGGSTFLPTTPIFPEN